MNHTKFLRKLSKIESDKNISKQEEVDVIFFQTVDNNSHFQRFFESIP